MIKNLLRLDLKIYMLCLLVLSAIIGMAQQGIAVTLPQVLIAVFTAGLLDCAIKYIKNKKIIFPLSALISGMIIALVLSPGVKWFIPLVASLAAILQKYIIRRNDRHIFNPANFGLLVVLFAFSSHVNWWGQSFWPLLVVAGIFICYRMKRLELPFVFIGSFILIFGLHNLLFKQPFLHSFFLLNIFFIFVMLIEPKTSPVTRKGRMMYAVIAALFGFVFFKIAPQYDFSLSSLAAANLFVPFLNKLI